MSKKIFVVLFAIVFSLQNSGVVFAQEVAQNPSLDETITETQTEKETNESTNNQRDDQNQNDEENKSSESFVEQGDTTDTGLETTGEEETTPSITSCDDVYNTSDLLVYLEEFDGSLDCIGDHQVEYLPRYNIFPGEEVLKVISITIDGVEYDLASAPRFVLGNLDEEIGILMGTVSFPYNFPNWESEELPTQDEPVAIQLVYRNSCEDLTPTEVLLEYLERFDQGNITLICEVVLPTLSIQDEITIEKGSDLISQLTFTLDGVDYKSTDLTLASILDGFTSDSTGVFTVHVGAQKDGASTLEEVIVTVVDTTSESSGGNGGGGSSSGTLIGGTSPQGQVAGAFDDNTSGEVLGESTTSCPVFSNFHRKGDKGGEVTSIQAFLNTHMDAGLSEDGIYGPLTEKAVHAFQQKYWDQIIKPWTPALSSRTTGRWYKTTNAWANVLSGCSVEPILIEDTGAMYTPSITENQA